MSTHLLIKGAVIACCLLYLSVASTSARSMLADLTVVCHFSWDRLWQTRFGRGGRLLLDRCDVFELGQSESLKEEVSF